MPLQAWSVLAELLLVTKRKFSACDRKWPKWHFPLSYNDYEHTDRRRMVTFVLRSGFIFVVGRKLEELRPLKVWLLVQKYFLLAKKWSLLRFPKMYCAPACSPRVVDGTRYLACPKQTPQAWVTAPGAGFRHHFLAYFIGGNGQKWPRLGRLEATSKAVAHARGGCFGQTRCLVPSTTYRLHAGAQFIYGNRRRGHFLARRKYFGHKAEILSARFSDFERT